MDKNDINDSQQVPQENNEPLLDEDFQEILEEDNDPPFSKPDDVEEDMPLTHPKTDSASDIDAHELYDEGIEGATESDPR